MTTSRHKTMVVRTLALSTEVTFLRRSPGGLESHAGNALDLGPGIGHGVKGPLIRAGSLAALGYAEIDAGGQLTHTEDIKTVTDNIRPQGAGGGQRLEDPGRTQVAEEVKMLAQGQQRRPFGLCAPEAGLPTWGRPPIRTGWRRCVRKGSRVEGGQSLAMIINGNAADIRILVTQIKREFLPHCVQDLNGLCHHFRTDAITSQYCNFPHSIPLIFLCGPSAFKSSHHIIP